MRDLLLKTLLALLGLILLSQLAARAMPGTALAQPERPTLTPAPPPTATRKPDRDPTDTPIPTATEQPTAAATPAPTAVPAPTEPPAPAQLPSTGDQPTDWSAAIMLALLLWGMGMLLRPRFQMEDGGRRTKDK